MSGFNGNGYHAKSLKGLRRYANRHMFQHFINTDGSWKKENDTVQLPELATTLREIRDDPDALYTGNRRFSLLKDIEELDGIIVEDDLKNYKVLTPTPEQIKIRDLTVLTMPAPSFGPLASLMLNMAKIYITKDIKKENMNAEMYHKLIETFKFANFQMSLIGDPSLDPVVVEESKRLVDEGFASMLVKKIGPHILDSEDSYYVGPPPVKHSGTTHISVIDSSDLMVSMSLSHGGNFGIRFYLSRTGIYINGELIGFSQPSDDHFANGLNHLAPKKRPQSPLCPMVVYNKDNLSGQRMVLGAVHGNRIVPSLVQVLINTVLLGDSLPEAISAPRLYNDFEYTEYEKTFPSQFVTELMKKGQNMTSVDVSKCHVTGIMKIKDEFTFGIDPRSLSVEDHY